MEYCHVATVTSNIIVYFAVFTMKHCQQLLVLQHDGSLYKILEVRIHSCPDPCVLSHPLRGYDIYMVAYLKTRYQSE